MAICAYLALASSAVSGEQPVHVVNSTHYDFALMELDSYSFRRAYHGHDTLSGEDLEVFMNRNPEGEDYSNSREHALYAALCKTRLFLDGNLNLTEIDTLPEDFSLQFSPGHFCRVKTTLLQDPKAVKTPGYELTFTEKNKVILIDTLEFAWPPDVTFMKTDLDEDGTEELISIFRWYIINGDNFDVKIYNLSSLTPQEMKK